MFLPKQFLRRAFLGMLLASAIGPGLKSQTDDDAAAFDHLVMKGIPSPAELLPSLAPTIEDCRAVFKADGADLVFHFSKDMFAEIARNPSALGGGFVDFRTSHFTTEEALTNRDAVTGGMRGIKDYLLPKITFYQVSYLRTEGAEYGVTYRYFVKVGDHWVFFPKPWRAFESGN